MFNSPKRTRVSEQVNHVARVGMRARRGGAIYEAERARSPARAIVAKMRQRQREGRQVSSRSNAFERRTAHRIMPSYALVSLSSPANSERQPCWHPHRKRVYHHANRRKQNSVATLHTVELLEGSSGEGNSAKTVHAAPANRWWHTLVTAA